MPGVNRASSKESNDGEDGEPTDGEGSMLVSVAALAGSTETTVPHAPQKRLGSGTSDEHDGQRMGQGCQKTRRNKRLRGFRFSPPSDPDSATLEIDRDQIGQPITVEMRDDQRVDLVLHLGA